jgi:hypothetical protein
MRIAEDGRRTYRPVAATAAAAAAAAAVAVSGHPLNTYLVWDQRE